MPRTAISTALKSIAYHEGIPGHHLQISIAQELKDVPEFRKYDAVHRVLEGWGLYAEQLGKDVGFYQDPYSDYGRLEGDIWRAIRLVVDTGVHSEGWTRQQMVQYFHDHSNVDEPSIQAEVDRYIAWPSQALAYKMGQLKILELRARRRRNWDQVRHSRLSRPGDRLGRIAAGCAGAAHRCVDRGAKGGAQ